MNEIHQLIAQFGALGVLLWLVLHIFRVLIPETLDRFRKELEAQRHEFGQLFREMLAAVRRQREAFELLAQRIEELMGDDAKRAARRVDKDDSVRE